MVQTIQLNARDDSLKNQMVICGQFTHLTDPDNPDHKSFVSVPRLQFTDLGNDSNAQPIIRLESLTSYHEASNRPADILAKRVSALQQIRKLVEDSPNVVPNDVNGQELAVIINRQCNNIAHRTRRGAGNVLIIHPDNSKLLPLQAIYNTHKYNLQVVTSPDIPVDDIIVGYVGVVVMYDSGVTVVERDFDRHWTVVVHPHAASYYRLIRIGK